jgi:hypothetical protein
MRQIHLFGFILGLAPMMACGGGDDDEGRDAGSQDGGASDSGEKDAGGSSSDAGSAKAGLCLLAPGSTSASPCARPQFEDCARMRCPSQLTTCYGADWQKGTFAGPCTDYATCASKCSCDDSFCLASCKVSGECETCKGSVKTCSASCNGYAVGCGITQPAFDHTCEELSACCSRLTSTQQKFCDLSVTKKDEAQCAVSFTTDCQTGP